MNMQHGISKQWHTLLLTLAASASISVSHCFAVSTTPTTIFPSRQAFARKMAHLKNGMSKKQVEALLGKPDYVEHFRTYESYTIWSYGCAGLHQFATLGSVIFDGRGKVEAFFGGSARPPAPKVISEKELRVALVLLDETPTDENYNPDTTVRVVNALLPLGKTKILAAMREYERVSGALDAQPLIFLLRVLFDIPGHNHDTPLGTAPMPGMRIGATYPPPPADGWLLPRYPMAIVDDIPFLELRSVELGGVPEAVSDEIPYFQAHATLRTKPLHPSDRPWEAVSRLEASPQWLDGHPYKFQADYDHGFLDKDRSHDKLREQILRMLEPLYPSVIHRVQFNPGQFHNEIDLEQWNGVIADSKKHPIHWNVQTNRYEHSATVRSPIGILKRLSGFIQDTPVRNP